MSSDSKESLTSDLLSLQTKLSPVLERDRKRIEGEGRPFDLIGWVMGVPDSHKYPGGPAFLVSTSETVSQNTTFLKKM
jgi:hypothetical protein